MDKKEGACIRRLFTQQYIQKKSGVKTMKNITDTDGYKTIYVNVQDVI